MEDHSLRDVKRMLLLEAGQVDYVADSFLELLCIRTLTKYATQLSPSVTLFIPLINPVAKVVEEIRQCRMLNGLARQIRLQVLFTDIS